LRLGDTVARVPFPNGILSNVFAALYVRILNANRVRKYFGRALNATFCGYKKVSFVCGLELDMFIALPELTYSSMDAYMSL
jgi:hypothetical protein